MPYSIYRLKSPSGKVYIGVSKNVTVRWSSHKSRAKVSDKRHPLYDAIRCYGADNFTLEILSEHIEESEALATEVAQIASHCATDRTKGYNVSKGGEYDGAACAAIFWARMRANPEEFKAYRKRLSAACKKRGGPNVRHIIKYMSELPARDRWRQVSRATRVAARVNRGGTSKNGFDQKTPEHVKKMSNAVREAWDLSPPSFKKKHGMTARRNALALWANRTEQERKTLSNKISSTLSQRYANDAGFKNRNTDQLSSARACIDRKKQASAASKGLILFWVNLKKDPERYKNYIARRKSSLKDTNKKRGTPRCKK